MADRYRQHDHEKERGPRQRRDRGEHAGQERAWEDANRRRQGPDIPGEPGRWQDREGWDRQEDWRERGDWVERQPNWQERGWGNRQYEERGPNRRQDDWNTRAGPGGDWQDRARRERWFARDDRKSQAHRPEEEFSDENFYANRGWTRPSSLERERDWGYYRGQQIAGDRNQEGEPGLPIDYIGSDADRRNWRGENEFARGADADRLLSRRRAEGEWAAARSQAWNQRGPFSGMGPQGYRRSDERIKEEICERLTWHGQINASKIEIDVKEGEVTLRGQVERKNEKRLAEDVVEKIDGVKDVQNQLRVTQ